MSKSVLIKAQFLITTFLVVAMLLPVFNAKANFVPAPETPITVTITSPKQKDTIQSDQFTLHYTVTDIPQETITSNTDTLLFNTRVSLDGIWIFDPISFRITTSDFLSFNHSININKVNDGNHSLKILVYCKRHIDGIKNSNLDLQGNSEAIYFSTSQKIQTSPETNPTNTQQSLRLPSTIEIAGIVILVVIVLGLTLNIVKKRRT